MKIIFNSIENNKMEIDEININVEYHHKNKEIDKFIEYINKYKSNENRKIVVTNDNELVEILYKDIIMFYSDKKNNYCKTHNGCFKIKSKLYEIEQMDKDFIRISKNCIVNLNHVVCFDLGETGKIFAKLDNNTSEIVSRRKVREVMNFLDERSI